MRRLVTGIAATTLIAVTAACDPALLLPTDPPPVQAPASTVVEGDSIDVQWATSGGTDAFPGVYVHAGNGWAMTACPPVGCTTPLDDARAMTNAGLADRQVWMIGTNDAAGGFSQAEANGWATAMFDPPAETCEVWVEPWVTAPQPPEFIAAVNQVRAWIEQIAPLRPNTVVIDWAPYAQRPGVLGFDGVDLATVDNTNMAYVTSEAVQARSDIIRDGLAQCPRGAS